MAAAKAPQKDRQGLFPSSGLLSKLPAILIAGLIIGGLGYIITARNYTNHHSFVVQDGRPFKATMARGTNMTLELDVNGPIGGHWASDSGLTLTLDGINEPLAFTGPREQDWGDQFTTTTSSDDTSDNDKAEITGTIALPASISGPEQRTLSGTLSGNITYPEGGMFFQNQTEDISVPIQVQLLPQGSFLWSSGDLLFYAFSGLLLLCGALLFLLIAWFTVRYGLRILASYRIAHRRPRPQSHTGKKEEPIWAVILVLLFLSAIPTGLLLGLIFAATTIGASAPLPDEISHMNLFIPVILWVLVFFYALGRIFEEASRLQAKQ